MKIKIATVAIMCFVVGVINAQSIPIEGNKYHYYGPNSTWNEYLKVGGDGRGTINASVVTTNGNLHLDSKNGKATYLNYYSKGNTFLNARGGFTGIGTTTPFTPLHIVSNTNHHQLRLQGTNGKHSWLQFYPSGNNVLNWQIGANTNGFSIYDVTNSKYNFIVSNSGTVGIGTSTPNSNSGLHMYKDKYTLYGPNTTWGAYLQVGGNGRVTNYASVVSTNGNLHLDSKNGNATYLNHYSKGNTFLNPQGGNVGIGTTDTKGFKLGVKGKIAAEEVKVATHSNWADFVFYENYKLPTLEEVENHIKEKGHLKDIPSAKEVEKNGIFLGEMDSKLLQKIEELTLYTIHQEKEIKALKKQNTKIEKQEKEIAELKLLVQKLLNK